jgi:hypothetical protein
MKKIILILLILIISFFLIGCTQTAQQEVNNEEQTNIQDIIDQSSSTDNDEQTNEIKNCGSSLIGEENNSVDCFREAFLDCSLAIYSQIQDLGETKFEIFGLTNNSCILKIKAHYQNTLIAETNCSIPKEMLEDGFESNKINDYCTIVTFVSNEKTEEESQIDDDIIETIQQTTNTYWSNAQPFGVISQSYKGKVLTITIKNNDSQPLTLKSFNVGETKKIIDEIIFPEKTKIVSINLENLKECVSRENFSIKRDDIFMEYDTESIKSRFQKGISDLTGKCA